jgi:hypothetical protein
MSTHRKIDPPSPAHWIFSKKFGPWAGPSSFGAVIGIQGGNGRLHENGVCRFSPELICLGSSFDMICPKIVSKTEQYHSVPGSCMPKQNNTTQHPEAVFQNRTILLNTRKLFSQNRTISLNTRKLYSRN